MLIVLVAAYVFCLKSSLGAFWSDEHGRLAWQQSAGSAESSTRRIFVLVWAQQHRKSCTQIQRTVVEGARRISVDLSSICKSSTSEIQGNLEIFGAQQVLDFRGKSNNVFLVFRESWRYRKRECVYILEQHISDFRALRIKSSKFYIFCEFCKCVGRPANPGFPKKEKQKMFSTISLSPRIRNVLGILGI